MRVSFRQGIIQYQVDNQNNQNFLLATNTGVSLLANDKPFIATFAHKEANYLIEERTSITNAWTGPFVAQQQYWLWIDIQTVTGAVTFGQTLVPPLVGPIAPTNPVADQHWFDTSTTQMKVWNSYGWQVMIRVFAGVIVGGAQSFQPIFDQTTYGGSQAGLNVANFSGFIIFDAFGKPIRTNDSTFLTTETTTTVAGSTGNVRYAADLLTATALEPIPSYSVVYFYDFDEIKLATPTLDTSPRIYGIVTGDLVPNDATYVYVDCVITNDHWFWPTMNAYVYAAADGSVTTNRANTNQASIGYVVARNAIRLDPPQNIDITVTTGGGNSGGGNTGGNGGSSDLTMQELHDMMEQFGGTLTIDGPDTITEGQTGSYTLSFTASFDQAVTNPANAHIGCSGNVAYIDGNNVVYCPKPLATPQTVTLSAYYPYGFNVITATKDVQLVKQQPISIQIQGPAQIYEGSSGIYQTVATYADGSTATITNAVYTITKTTVASVNQSNLAVQLFAAAGVQSGVNTIADQITATLTLPDGTVLTSALGVQYLRVLPVSLAVSGQSSVLVGNTAHYVSTVTYNNGSTKVVTTASAWSLTDTVGMSSINAASGVLTTSVAQFVQSAVTVQSAYNELGVVLTATESVNLLVGAFYGTGVAQPTNMAAFIPTLQNRTSGGKATTFSIDDLGDTVFMWYCYPMSFGTATFSDVLSQQIGGWDGAGSSGNFATTNGGPIQVTMTSNGQTVVWYAYRTDHSNLGAAAINQWQVS